MSDENVSAVTGEHPGMPAETIATNMPTMGADEGAPAAAPEAEPPQPEAEATEAEADEGQQPEQKQEGQKPEKLDWRERRRIEETNKRKAAEAELERQAQRTRELENELKRLRGGEAAEKPQTTEPKTLEQLKEQARAEARMELEREQQSKQFQEATGRVLKAGQQAYQDFDQKRMELVQNFGEELQRRPDFFEAIIDMDNGHDVFYALASDPEQAEHVLSLPPVKMALRLAQLSAATAKPSEPERKPISKAPPPIKPVNGAAQVSNRLDDEAAPMDNWAQTFLKQMAGRGR